MCDHAMQSFIEPLAIRCQPNPLKSRRREEFQIVDVERRRVCGPLSVAFKYRIGTRPAWTPAWDRCWKPRSVRHFLPEFEVLVYD